MKTEIIKDLDYYLNEITISSYGEMIDDFNIGSKMYKLNSILEDWYALVTEEGIIAYFNTEKDALRARLDYINKKLNP